MDEFDIELDSDIGTSVSKIKNKEQNVNNEIHKYSETDIDYDKVIEILDNSETKNSHVGFVEQTRREDVALKHINSSQSHDTFNSYVQDVRPKREINMNKFVKNIESNIDNFNKINFNEPLPVNFSKNMVTQNIDHNLENFNQVPPVETIKMKLNNELKQEQDVDNKSLFTKIFSWKYLDIILYILIFMLLNNKFIIELIYDRVPYIKSIESPYPNLILRSLVFGLLIFLIKKFNL